MTGNGERIEADGSRYLGKFEFKKYHGMGKLYYPNSNVLKYDGRWEKGIMHGRGTLYNPDGTIKYKGNFVDNLYDGDGEIINSFGKAQYAGYFEKGIFKRGRMLLYVGDKFLGDYDGAFKNDKPDGNLRFYLPNNSSTQVVFQDGKLKQGVGILIYNQDYYHGEVKDFQENGSGKYYQADGKIFEGLYINGKISTGTGVVYFDNKKKYKYEGYFLNGLKHGEGTCYDLTQNPPIQYKGTWEHDKPVSGKAMYFYENGDYYIGDWEKGQKVGIGTYYYCAGDKYEGHWKNGLQFGQGIFYYQDGRTYDGYFNKGCRVDFKD